MNYESDSEIVIAEILYYEKNPTTRMDVPSSAYEMVNRWRHEWIDSKSELTLYNWIKKNKQ